MSSIEQLLFKYDYSKSHTVSSLDTTIYSQQGRFHSTLLFVITEINTVGKELVQQRIEEIYEWISLNVYRQTKLSQIGINFILLSKNNIERSFFEVYIDMDARKVKDKLSFKITDMVENTKDILVQSITNINTQTSTVQNKKTWLILGSVRKVLKELQKGDWSG